MQKPSRILVLSSRPTLLAFTALRVVVGAIMVAHGAQKLADPGKFAQNLERMGVPLPELSAWLAIAGELLGGLGLVVGLLTPIAAFGVAVTMAVATFGVHFKNGLFAANGGYEYPLVLLLSSLWYMAAGGGPYSLDALVRAWREDHPDTSESLARPLTTAVPGPDALRDRARDEDGLEPVTEAGIESFPASDPPAHTRRDH